MNKAAIKYELSGKTAARLNPDKYPGWWPSKSFVIHNNETSFDPELFYLAPPALGLQSEGSEKLDLSMFRAGHLEVFSAETDDYKGSLNKFLRDRGLAPMEQRVPVLAVGSNASPSQMAYKFKESGLSGTIPTIRVSVSGHGVGFVPGVSSFGYVPATLIRRKGLSSELFLQFLDLNQLVVMDESEGVHKKTAEGASSGGTLYNRVSIRSKILMPHGEQLQIAYAYVGLSGFLSIDGKPVLCDNSAFALELAETDKRPTVNETSEHLIRCSSQHELFELIGQHDKDLESKLQLALKNPNDTNKENINSRLSKLSIPKVIKSQRGIPLDVTYQDLDKNGLRQSAKESSGPSENAKSRVPKTFITLPSPNDVERQGESVVILQPEDFESLGNPTYLSVSSEPINQMLGYRKITSKRSPEVIARVQLAVGQSKESLEKALGSILVDEVLRVATGLHVGERAQLRELKDPKRPLSRAWFKFLKFVLGKPNYVSGRAVLSDVTTMERDVALVTPLTMQMLGIESGDFAVMEGVHSEAGELKIKTVSVRVFPVDEKTLEKREKSQLGGWLSLIPDARVCLGVHIDLAPIFIDAALREFLFGSKPAQSVGVIRLRASFPEKVSSEIRELLVVILLAVLAWILTIPNQQLPFLAKSLTLVAIVVLAFVLILFRIRNRSRHTKRSRK